MESYVTDVFPVTTLDEVKNDTLRERAKRAKNNRTIEFVAVSKNIELALLSYEDWSEESLGFIYEIYVIPDYRRNGVGTLLLSYAEGLATQRACTKIRLKPYALDKKTDNTQLLTWYTKNGYILDIHDPERIMEKFLKRALT